MTESSMLHLVVHFFAIITIDALTQLAVFTRAKLAMNKKLIITHAYSKLLWLRRPRTCHSMLVHEALMAVHSSYGYGLLT